jgi:dihydropteroate synthase
VDEGADLIDIGGESTRPGSRPPTVQEELTRVIPVIAALSQHVQVPLSVDTSRPEVMRAAAAEGASMINDVRALRRPGALEAVAELGVPDAHAALAAHHAGSTALPRRRRRGA